MYFTYHISSLNDISFTCTILFLLQGISISLRRKIFIHSEAFSGLSNLTVLRIDKYELSSPPPLDNIRESLLVLTVKNANLSAIPHSYFSGCDSLQQLILKQNRLTTIPNLLDVSDTLRFVNFDHNDITAVTPLYDLIFPVLKYVYLMHNKIHQVDVKRLHFPRLHGMDLRCSSRTGSPDTIGTTCGNSWSTRFLCGP